MINLLYSFNHEGETYKMTALCVFRKGISPAWEEHINHFGGDFSTQVKSIDKEKTKELWDKLVFRVIGSQYDYSENVKLLINSSRLQV